LRTFKDLSDDGGGARIGKYWEASIDDEVVEGCEYRVTVPFRRLFVVFRQREQKLEDFFLGNAGEISFAKSQGETIEDELTGLDGIFFSSWPGGTADENRLPGKLS
jgi:hypothetical protein